MVRDIVDGEGGIKTRSPKIHKNKAQNVLDELFDDTDSDPNLQCEGEVDRYLKAEFLDVPSDLNIFWRNNEKNLPGLAKLAKKILSLPASTAENERSFSKLRFILNDYRDNLSA